MFEFTEYFNLPRNKRWDYLTQFHTVDLTTDSWDDLPTDIYYPYRPTEIEAFKNIWMTVTNS